MALDRLQKPWDAIAMPLTVHRLDGGTSISCHCSASLTLPASGKLSPASLPEHLWKLQTLAVIGTAFFLSVQYTPALRENVAAAPKS